MKVQTGVRIEAEVWQAYRDLCRREKLRPSHPIEDFLRLALESDSVLSGLKVMREAARSRVDGLEAYARVLLEWHTNGKLWVSSGDDDVSVELLLLEALKTISDADLRRRIEEALIAHRR